MTKLVDDSLPLIPTDLTIHLVEEDEEDEGGFQVVREPLQVEVHRLVLALVSPVLRTLLYNHPQPPSITLACSSGALRAVLDHVYGRQMDWARLSSGERDQVAALGKQYQIEGLLESIRLAEEDLLDNLFENYLEENYLVENYLEEDYLDNLFATSLQSSLLSTEPDILDNFCATSQQTSNLFLSPPEKKATTAEVESRVKEESEFPANYTSNIAAAMKEHITQDGHKDTVDTDQDDEMVEGEEKEEEVCRNCGCLACLDGEVIASTLDFGGRLGCQAAENLNNTTCFILNSKTEVAVANCVTSYWGNRFRAQQGKVSKIDCLDRVTVRWVDGSESQFNVHPTDRPDTDTVLCFHCR